MKHRNIIFHQLLQFLPRYRFQEAVDRHQGDHRVRKLSCWDQFVVMLFGQLSNRKSLRDLVDTFNSKRAHHYHLGTRIVNRSSLSDANSRRPVAVFKETFFYLLNQVKDKHCAKVSNEMVRLIDSTTIDLNLTHYEWASFRTTKAGVKLHTVFDPSAEVPVYFEMTRAKTSDHKALSMLPVLPGMTYVVDRAYNDYKWYYQLTKQKSVFVGRMKSNALYDVIETCEPEGEGIISDEIIKLSSEKAKKDCPISLRRITFVRKEDQKTLVFITNDMTRTATEIAELYKQRWQIELFFKWIKQNLKIKRFLGQSENAVLIQVLVAMIAYLLIKLVELSYKTAFSLQQIARIISVNLTSRQPILCLLNPPPDPKKNCTKRVNQLDLGFKHV